jgi:4-amino-4-deoxy-L-arabinose transferase-like glycosyltransferase
MSARAGLLSSSRLVHVVRPARIFWLIALVALVLMLLFLPRSPLPWLDEIFFASTSLSIVRGGPPVATVLAAFPHTVRADLFYGPLVFFLGSIDIRLFGLSATSWRLVGFFGAVGAVFSAAWVSRRLDRSQTAMAAAAMLVALSQGMGARATSGRLDTVTVTLELLSLACTLGGMRANEPRLSVFVYASLAGILCGLAALSTPRAFPFVLGLFVALGLELALAWKRESVTRSLIIGASALLPVWGWTLSQGMNPIGWLRFIAAASRGDKISVSPLLHGTWHLFDGPVVPLFSGLLFILMIVLVSAGVVLTGGRAVEMEGHDVVTGVRLASIVVLTNYVASFLTISRFWDYEIFVVPLAIPLLIALSSKILRSGERRVLQGIILGSWLMLAIVLVAIRSGKAVAWLASYRERDPQPLQHFVSNNVPVNSRVFGPDEFYFYAVEAAGSHYLFERSRITTGLMSKLDYKANWQEQLEKGHAVYLIWPKDDMLPLDLCPCNLRLEGSFSAQLGKEPIRWRKAGWGSGYPDTNLYQVVDGQK